MILVIYYIFHTGKTEFHYQGNEITQIMRFDPKTMLRRNKHMFTEGTHDWTSQKTSDLSRTKHPKRSNSAQAARFSNVTSSSPKHPLKKANQTN